MKTERTQLELKGCYWLLEMQGLRFAAEKKEISAGMPTPPKSANNSSKATKQLKKMEDKVNYMEFVLVQQVALLKDKMNDLTSRNEDLVSANQQMLASISEKEKEIESLKDILISSKPTMCMVNASGDNNDKSSSSSTCSWNALPIRGDGISALERCLSAGRNTVEAAERDSIKLGY